MCTLRTVTSQAPHVTQDTLVYHDRPRGICLRQELPAGQLGKCLAASLVGYEWLSVSVTALSSSEGIRAVLGFFSMLTPNIHVRPCTASPQWAFSMECLQAEPQHLGPSVVGMFECFSRPASMPPFAGSLVRYCFALQVFTGKNLWMHHQERMMM